MYQIRCDGCEASARAALKAKCHTGVHLRLTLHSGHQHACSHVVDYIRQRAVIMPAHARKEAKSIAKDMELLPVVTSFLEPCVNLFVRDIFSVRDLTCKAFDHPLSKMPFLNIHSHKRCVWCALQLQYLSNIYI